MKVLKLALKDGLNLANIPLSAKKYLPGWYKDAKPFIGGKYNYSSPNRTFKQCSPFLDAMTSGYIFESWTDVHVSLDENGHPLLNWANGEHAFITTRSEVSHKEVPAPAGCHEVQLVLKHPLYIKTPPGYSILMTNPLNRHDLPFIFLSGVVDTDIHCMYPGNYPFYLKKGFEGTIPAGTPLIQIIPFKRDSWKSNNDESIIKEAKKSMFQQAGKFYGWYKQFAWQKKEYN